MNGFGLSGAARVRRRVGPTSNHLNILIMNINNTITAAVVAKALTSHGKLTGPVNSVTRVTAVHVRGGRRGLVGSVIPLTGLGSVMFNN